MRIGIIAPPWLPVPPPGYGGTEFMIDLLAVSLQDLGHEVTLFTTGDSTSAVTCAWLYSESLGTTRVDDSDAEERHLAAAYEALAGVDVIHDHSLVGPGWQRAAAPVVTTMHGPMDEDTQRRCQEYPDNVAVVAISHSQRSSAPDVHFAGVIHHGIRVGDVPVSTGAGGYLLTLARMSPTKGIHRAIEIARRADKPLVIAAKLQEPAEQAYFDEEVGPHLRDDIVYVGEVDRDEKFRMIGDATALLNPIEWAEPFGLVMIEALASGTPVIASTWGSAPELIEDGRTGFICPDDDAAVAACERVGELSRADCRRAAEQRFSAERMVGDYEELFRSLVGRAGAVRMTG